MASATTSTTSTTPTTILPTGGLRRERRDALTGRQISDDELRNGGPVMIVRDRDVRVRYSRRTGQPIEMDAVPATIDSREQYPQGHLGGRRWTAPFARYIAPVLPNSIEQQEIARVRWWEDPYAQGRVRNRFRERYGDEKGAHAYRLALIVIRQPTIDLADLAEQTGFSASYIQAMVKLAYRFAFRPSQQLAASAAVASRRYQQERASRARLAMIARDEQDELAERAAQALASETIPRGRSPKVASAS